jgi:UDP-2,4-diacetamido-2,4,6-trideoxy-beta-L-altropyranose hydrolase
MEIKAMNIGNYQIKDPLHFVFRLDAGSPVGNGHLMRSMVLCMELLERGHQVLLLVCQVPVSLLTMLREKGIAVQMIAQRSDGLQEIAQIHQENPIDWLVIDHYGIDAQWESVARRFAAHTMVIDDLANRRHACDLLLDQNVPNRLQEQYENLVPKNCVKAIGWSYLLARSEFYIRDCCDRSGTLIFLGGGNHTLELTGLIEKLLSQTELHPLKILVSSEYLPCTHWQNLVGDCGQVYCDLTNPAPLYRSAKLALVRCGFVSYELALIGIPTVHIYSSVVQKEVARSLETLDIGLALSEEHLFRSGKLNEAINQVSVMNPVPVNEKLSSGAIKVAMLLENFHEYS